jgi:hypothetical protein
MTEAKKKYDDKFCLKWNVTMAYPRYDGKLTQAFRKTSNHIISLMPMRTCRCIDNHDGQLTDQKEFTLCGKVDYQNYLLRITIYRGPSAIMKT